MSKPGSRRPRTTRRSGLRASAPQRILRVGEEGWTNALHASNDRVELRRMLQTTNRLGPGLDSHRLRSTPDLQAERVQVACDCAHGDGFAGLQAVFGVGQSPLQPARPTTGWGSAQATELREAALGSYTGAGEKPQRQPPSHRGDQRRPAHTRWRPPARDPLPTRRAPGALLQLLPSLRACEGPSVLKSP